MPGLLLYFLGYRARAEFNMNAVETQCNITQHEIVKNECSYQCNPHQVCTTQTTGTQTCRTEYDTCYETCYDGFLSFIYFNQEHTLIYSKDNYQMAYGLDTTFQVQAILNMYPIGESFTCFYNTKKPHDVKLQEDLENPRPYLDWSIAILVLSCIMMTAGLVLFLVYYINCRSLSKNLDMYLSCPKENCLACCSSLEVNSMSFQKNICQSCLTCPLWPNRFNKDELMWITNNCY